MTASNQMTDQRFTLDKIVDRCQKLYTLPMVAVRVLQLTESPSVDVRALKQCIENDPALTCKILRVVNSSLFGLSREVSDLNQALALLGINPLKLLVLGFSLPDNLFANVHRDILRRYWHHSLIKAVASREISQTIWGLPGDEPFIAGLLQDLGMLVLLQELGEPYARFLDHAFARARDVAANERKSFGFDHLQLSSQLLERWSLPRNLVQAVEIGQDHNRLAELTIVEQTLPQILHLSELLANILAENRCDLLAELLDAGHRYHRLTHLQLTRLVESLQSKVDQLAEVLCLDLPTGNNYLELLGAAHAQLSGTAEQAAGELLQHKLTTKPIADRDSKDELQLLGDATAMAGAARRVTAMSNSAMSNSVANPVLVASLGARESITTAFEVDPALAGRVAAVVAACRQARCPLSLLLVEVDRYDELMLHCGAIQAERLVKSVGDACRQVDHPHAQCMQTRDLQFAVIAADCDRREAVELAGEIAGRVRLIWTSGGADETHPSMSVSIGVSSLALPPKNFPATVLIESAERCLGGARHSGGNSVKSIEIY